MCLVTHVHRLKTTVCLSRYSLHLATVFQSQVTNQASPPFYYIFESVATWRRLRKYETWRCPSLFCIYIANVCMNKYLYFILFYLCTVMRNLCKLKKMCHFFRSLYLTLSKTKSSLNPLTSNIALYLGYLKSSLS